MKEETWQSIRQAFFSSMPWPLRLIVPTLIRRGVKGALKKQGIGRHSEEEILSIAERTLESVSVLLADKPYIMGDTVCSLDATVYAFLASLILVDLDDPFTQNARKYQNLVDYCQRIQQQYYSEQAH
jgi:glutathione S-transferase